MKRRTLIKSLSLAGLSGLSLPHLVQATVLRPFSEYESEESYWAAVREQFELDSDLAFMNNGTIGPNPKPVLKAIIERLESMARKVDYNGWHKARAEMAALISAMPKEIALTSNTTHGNNIVAQGLRMKRGREIITTTHEHVGNAMPLLTRAKSDRLRIKVFNPELTANAVLNQIEDLITRKTALIAIPHISCTTGQVFPIKKIAALIESKNIFLAVDGAHGPGSRVLDVKSLGCDSYSANCHKWMMGAYGTGFLYIREERIPEMEVVHSGHANSKSWKLTPDEASFEPRNDNAARFMFGTHSVAQFEGSIAAVRFLNEIGMERIEGRVAVLQSRLMQGLLDRADKLDVLSPEEGISHGPMTTFRPKRMSYKDFYLKAMKKKIVTRQLAEADLNAIRISTHIYNSPSDVDKLLHFIDEVLN